MKDSEKSRLSWQKNAFDSNCSILMAFSGNAHQYLQ
jgi:hypothetical protein